MQRTPARASRAHNRTLASVLTVTAVLAISCAGPTDDRDPTSTSVPETAAPQGAPTASVDGSDIVLTDTDGTRNVLASVEGAELLHVEVRPAVTEPVTVLALTREDDRYELRYLAVVDGTPTDLYWFPSRIQVDPGAAHVLDVPTLPVWAPDGSGLAWLEWGEDGTRLRTVGWYDHDLGTNPSDDQATYEVATLPVGTQLARWEEDDDGTTVLITRGGDADRWRIRIEEGEPIIALEPMR